MNIHNKIANLEFQLIHDVEEQPDTEVDDSVVQDGQNALVREYHAAILTKAQDIASGKIPPQRLMTHSGVVVLDQANAFGLVEHMDSYSDHFTAYHTLFKAEAVQAYGALERKVDKVHVLPEAVSPHDRLCDH